MYIFADWAVYNYGCQNDKEVKIALTIALLLFGS